MSPTPPNPHCRLALLLLAFSFVPTLLPSPLAVGARELVEVRRVPASGIQPQVAVGPDGDVHMIYFTGDAAAGDVHHIRSDDDGRSFSPPLRVNRQPGSVIAIGNVRGAQLAVGKNGRAHVAWMGSKDARPRGPGGKTPMLYARLDDAGKAFEKERNLIRKRPGLDGGGSVAADRRGNVYVAWHAPGKGGLEDEAHRRVWIAHSSDEGRTFSQERAAYREPTGACGCCGMRAFADSKGAVYMLYRSATRVVHRDMYLLAATGPGADFKGLKVGAWQIPKCVMSTAGVAEGAGSVVAAWEAEEQVYCALVDPATLRLSSAMAPVAAANQARRFPAVAANTKGQVILVWSEGMGWKRGGDLAWQVFGRDGQLLPDASGRRPGVPVWSLPAVFARGDGGFTVVY